MAMKTIFRGATMIPCTGENSVKNSVVVVEGNKIAAVETEESYVQKHGKIDDGSAKIIDAQGKYLIPGLVNCHEHLDMHRMPGTIIDRIGGPIETLVLQVLGNAILDLAMGVTSVRDLGSMGFTNILIRDAIDAGRVVGPRVQACGQMISITGGHGHPMAAEADGPDDVRRATRQQIGRGADVIKVCASGGIVIRHRENPMAQQLNDDELRAAVEEAHNAGLKIAAHAQPPRAIKASVLAGVDTIEHGAFLDEECADLLAEHGTFLVPTFDDSLTVVNQGHKHGRAQWQQEAALASLESRRNSIRLSKAAGVEIGVGSDVVGECGREMAALVECGFTPMQALVSGTRIGAKIMGLEDEIGTIEVGKLADLVLLDMNPLEDPSVCDHSVNIVVKDGVIHRPSELLSIIPGMASNIDLTTEAPSIMTKSREVWQ